MLDKLDYIVYSDIACMDARVVFAGIVSLYVPKSATMNVCYY